MKDFGRKSTFSSFLPGIAGIKGIPMWSFYVNRGQGICSFGIENKNQSIMEFSPAHVAYSNVKRTGFRTFLKVNGKFFEPFSDETLMQEMDIEKNLFTIKEENGESGIGMTVSYYILPEERLGALVREVKLTNNSDKEVKLEVLDGMPAIIPYGISMDNLKNMTQTAKAWMQVEKTERGNAFYRVRASLEDSTTVKEIKGGNFAKCYLNDGTSLYPVADPEVVFDYDNSFGNPVVFKEGGLDLVSSKRENVSNIFPCAFFGLKKTLKPGESLSLNELYGHADTMAILDTYAKQAHDEVYFSLKKKRARELADELCDVIDTKTGDKTFDEYVKYTYMDNVLRGGFPIRLGNNKIFYVYSRKHGDIERDYNFFSMLPEYYSEGNGSYRDINQNRRCDTFFAPFVDKENIDLFYSLIQLDGYNPLGIDKLTYEVDDNTAKCVTEKLPDEIKEPVLKLITKPFTPGSLFLLLDGQMKEEEAELSFNSIIDFAKATVNGSFQEGYWCDHWTYNLDLLEDYLEVFPDREEELLFEKRLNYFNSQANILPRSKRYSLTEKGLRQYSSLDESTRRDTPDKLLRGNFGKGEVITSTLMEKLILLCSLKFAALDAKGMGIEMEGGKPGWYDALNGMPALLGSSMGETYELARMLELTIDKLEKYDCDITLLKEIGEVTTRLYESTVKNSNVFDRWNENNNIKEAYRLETYEGIKGDTKDYSAKNLAKMLKTFLSAVKLGIEEALRLGDGLCPMYFTYDVMPKSGSSNILCEEDFKVKTVPAFLEGQVRFLKLNESKERKLALVKSVKNGDLYDKKLKMYKVNASLNDASYELGRARAFTPGWLENESIWLHMEYKYLLELIRSGLYKEYFEDFHNACIPFLDEEMYGRSVLENSSFLASSANPNESIHGKGFVARLSGSTIEFISMWKLMMFGKNPFYVKNGELKVKFEPVIPAYLIGDDKTVSATFLGNVKVNYSFKEKKDYLPGEYKIVSMNAKYKNKTMASVTSGEFNSTVAKDIREGRVKEIDIIIQ